MLQAQIRKETDERKRAERRLAELEVARKEDKSIQMEDESMQIEDEAECDMENELDNEQLQSKAKSSAKAKKTSATAKVGTFFLFASLRAQFYTAFVVAVASDVEQAIKISQSAQKQLWRQEILF